jgi:hypothetical protein
MKPQAAAQIALQIVALVLLTLGAANAYLATIVETCTQSVADSMQAGVFSVPLYAGAFWILLRWRLPLTIVLLLLPAFVFIGYEAWWTVRFGYEYLINAVSMCGLITGEGGFEFDGREPFYLALWTVLSLFGTAGMVAVVLRAFRDIVRRRRSPSV